MQRLLSWIVCLAALFACVWFGVAWGLDRGIKTVVADARADGWQIDHGALTTTGFPRRLDLSLEAPDIVAADGKWAWQGPSLQLSAPSFHPTRITATLPQSQTLRWGDQTVQVVSDDLQLQVNTRLNPALSLDVVAVQIVALRLVSDFGWQISLDHAQANVTVGSVEDASYTIYLVSENLSLPEELVAQIAPDTALGNVIDRVDLDAVVSLDRPVDRFSFEPGAARPVIKRIVLTAFDLNWSDIALNIQGALDVDTEGVPEGQMTLKTAQWQTLIDVMVSSGAIDPGIAPTLANVAAAMANDSGVLELPVTFRDGFMSMGLLPLGPAPRLHQ